MSNWWDDPLDFISNLVTSDSASTLSEFLPSVRDFSSGFGFGGDSAEGAMNIFEPAMEQAVQSAPSTFNALTDGYGMGPFTEAAEASGPSFMDYLNKAGDIAGSKGGKLAIGGIGGLVSYMDAMKRNALMKQMAEQAQAARLAKTAASTAANAPARFTNQRTALPSWGAGQRSAFSKNSLAGMTPRSTDTMYAAEGGEVSGQGGLCQACGGRAHYVKGGAAGQSDKVPAMLSDGEYVMDADTVAALGDGNNAAGASALDQMRKNIRKHKRAAPINKIPPKAKKPEQYVKGAK
jgi:hypothetical protein